MKRLAPRPSSPPPAVEHLVNRVRGEYLEMPGLRLTLSQAQRLFALEPSACALVFTVLVQDRFLSCNADGRFAR